MQKRLLGRYPCAPMIPRGTAGGAHSVYQSTTRHHYSFEAQHMSDEELINYCTQNKIKVDLHVADRKAIVDAVERHKIHNVMGSTGILLSPSLNQHSQGRRYGRPKAETPVDVKSIKDQANALHIFVRSKKESTTKRKTPKLQLACVRPMEVVMVTGDDTRVCLTMRNGESYFLKMPNDRPASLPEIAHEAICFLRQSAPGKSYAMFTCDTTALVLKLLLGLHRGGYSDVEFTFDVPIFHRQMQLYHPNLYFAPAESSARTLALQLGVASPRNFTGEDLTPEEVELKSSGKDFHAVLRIFGDKLNPFGTGPGTEMDCLLTRPWGIALYQFVPREKYARGRTSEMTCKVYLVEEDITQSFTGGTKHQIVKDIVDWMKKIGKPFTRYIILYRDTLDAKMITTGAARVKLKCELLELWQFVPKKLRAKMKTADAHSSLWKPISMWKNWQQIVSENYSVQTDTLRAIRRYLVSYILFRKTVMHRMGRTGGLDNEKSATVDIEPAHIKTQSDNEFVLPQWFGFRTDPGRYERELACAQSYTDYLCMQYDRHDSLERLTTLRKGGPPQMATSMQSADVSALSHCQCLVAFCAKDLIHDLWQSKDMHAFFSRGGKVWCVTSAAYMLNGRDMARRDVMLEDARRFMDSPTLHPSKKVALIEELFLRQKKAAIDNRQFITIASMMAGAIMVNELRHARIYFDQTQIPIARKQMLDEITEIRCQLQHLVPSVMRADFKWDDMAHLKTLFLGGRIASTQQTPGEHLLQGITPADPSVALSLAAAAGKLTEEVLKKYAGADADATQIENMRRTAEHTASAGRPIHLLVAAHHTTGLNPTNDHIVELVLYNPMTGKVEKGKLSGTVDYLILSANGMAHGEPFIRKHLKNINFKTDAVHYADLSQIFLYAQSAGLQKQVCLKNRVTYKETTMQRHLLDVAVDLWRDLLSVSDGNAKRLIGALVGTPYDPFLTQTRSEAEEPETLPGMISYKNKLANAKLSEVGQSKSIDELMHHEGTTEARQLCKIMKLTRLIGSTYLSQDSMAGFLNGNYISPNLSFTETCTGRFTAKSPNILNVPKCSELRQTFASRFGGEGYILEIDYSMLEICTMAVLCGDQGMIDDMNANIDFHTRNLVVLNPQYTYEELIRKIKVENNPELIKLRERAKIFTFQRLYGASQRMIVETSGLSEQQVTSLIRDEKRRYPRMGLFCKEFEAVVHRLRPDIQKPEKLAHNAAIYIGEGVIPTGATFRFVQTTLAGMQKFTSTLLKNYPVQGLAAEIANVMASRLALVLKRRQYFGQKAFLVNVIHDSFVFDVHESVFEECLVLFRDMLQGVNLIFHEMYPEMNWKDVKFRVKASFGRTWGDQRPVQPQGP
ncbi:hypothetical protein XU18_1304 [Perkinsela sp. CCAP 1560/4]|nr:hypothetical protein XU18_1304 [Perkinsela sp. CCAP 1560/4]|eukprot:KNH08138.1 hypothetical protein XU18_1304 [Perkinsela sp. CCAP 1560/4]